MNDMKTPKDSGGGEAMGKKARDLERKIQKGFNVTKVDEGQLNKFANMMKRGKGGGSVDGDQIGSQVNKHVIRRRALRKQLLAKGIVYHFETSFNRHSNSIFFLGIRRIPTRQYW